MSEQALRELIAKVPHKYVDGPNCGWFDCRHDKVCGESPNGRHHIKYGSHAEISWMHEFEAEQIHDPDCPTCKLEAALAASSTAGEPWAYAIETPGGDMHDGEYAIFSDASSARSHVEDLNDEIAEDAEQYKLVPLYRVPAPVLREAPTGLVADLAKGVFVLTWKTPTSDFNYQEGFRECKDAVLNLLAAVEYLPEEAAAGPAGAPATEGVVLHIDYKTAGEIGLFEYLTSKGFKPIEAPGAAPGSGRG